MAIKQYFPVFFNSFEVFFSVRLHKALYIIDFYVRKMEITRVSRFCGTIRAKLKFSHKLVNIRWMIFGCIKHKFRFWSDTDEIRIIFGLINFRMYKPKFRYWSDTDEIRIIFGLINFRMYKT